MGFDGRTSVFQACTEQTVGRTVKWFDLVRPPRMSTPVSQ